MTGRTWHFYRFIALMLSGEEMRAGKWTAIESHKITAFKLCRIERRNQKRGIVTQWGMETAASSLVRRNWEMLMATRFRKSWVFCTRSRRTMSTIRFPRLSAENPLTTDCAHSVSTTRLQEWISHAYKAIFWHAQSRRKGRINHFLQSFRGRNRA